MANMTESEFVSAVLADKKYMVEVFRHIPDEVVEEQARKGKEQAGSGEELGANMVEFLAPATEAMGLSFDEAALAAEVDRQVRELSSVGKMKFLMRFATALKKAGKSGR